MAASLDSEVLGHEAQLSSNTHLINPRAVQSNIALQCKRCDAGSQNLCLSTGITVPEDTNPALIFGILVRAEWLDERAIVQAPRAPELTMAFAPVKGSEVGDKSDDCSAFVAQGLFSACRQ